MFIKRCKFVWGGVLVVALAIAALAGEATGQQRMRESYMAFAVNMSNIGMGRATTIQITIDRWSTETERRALLDTLAETGQEEMVKLLREQKEVGFVRVQGSGTASAGRNAFPSVRLHYARSYSEGGERHIVLVTERPINSPLAEQGSQAMSYDVSAITLQFPEEIGKTDKGKGEIYVGTKLDYDKEKNKITLEHFGSQPIRLTEVVLQKGS